MLILKLKTFVSLNTKGLLHKDFTPPSRKMNKAEIVLLVQGVGSQYPESRLDLGGVVSMSANVGQLIWCNMKHGWPLITQRLENRLERQLFQLFLSLYITLYLYVRLPNSPFIWLSVQTLGEMLLFLTSYFIFFIVKYFLAARNQV